MTLDSSSGLLFWTVELVTDMRTPSRASSLPQGICELPKSNVGASLLAMDGDTV
ncbi:hypothetical protein SAMN03159443_00800 [Pseudomonas sp. NFACC15-1]|nr:hypothetical protein SAMN03159443_00800 [Pseudomonas sp. NFACC15-1]SDB09584.1 hypothetical protein SAMN03159290_00669 [Pseudomonas sp. NFACC13-1]SDX22585.1 hypothetical protein SAMN03159380_01875 [Pseudomonas sp. NFACC14]